jgi:hypothetical protein
MKKIIATKQIILMLLSGLVKPHLNKKSKIKEEIVESIKVSLFSKKTK